MRRAKIVCTLGPATSSPERLRALVAAGMDVARLNLSHGSYGDHALFPAEVCAASNEAGRAVTACRSTLPGPKDPDLVASLAVRFWSTAQNASLLPSMDIPGDVGRGSDLIQPRGCRVTWGKPGDRLLIDDGKVALRAVEVTDTDIVTVVVEGGVNQHQRCQPVRRCGQRAGLCPRRTEAGTGATDLAAGRRHGGSFVRVHTPWTSKRAYDFMDEEGVRLPVIRKIE